MAQPQLQETTKTTTSSPPSKKKGAVVLRLPSPPLTPDSYSPTGVEFVDEYQSSPEQESQKSAIKRLMTKPLVDCEEKEQLKTILRKNADMATTSMSAAESNNREQRRLMALELVGEGPQAMRERLEAELKDREATANARRNILATIRKQREEDKAAAVEEIHRRRKLERKPSDKQVASKYSGLSRGLGVEVPRKKDRDKLKGFLADEGAKESEKAKKEKERARILSMSQSCSVLSTDETEITSGSQMSRSEQRWVARAEMSKFSTSSNMLNVGNLSGHMNMSGHFKEEEMPVRDEEEDHDDDASTTEPDFGSLESQSDGDLMKEESIRILPDPHPPRYAASASVCSSVSGDTGGSSTTGSISNASKPKGILKRSSTAPAPIVRDSNHSDTAAKSLLHSLYDGGKNMPLQRTMTADDANPPRRSERNDRRSSHKRSNSNRKLRDGSSRHESSSRRSSSRNNGEGEKREKDRENRGEREREKLNRSSSGRRLTSMSRAQSARRLQRSGQRSFRKSLEKTNSSSSRRSRDEESDTGTNVKQSKRVSAPAVASSPMKKTETRSKPTSGSSSSQSPKRSYDREGEISKSSHRESRDSGRERDSGGDRESRRERDGGDRGDRSRRTRSRSRARGEARGGPSERRRASSRSRSRSRARRSSTAKSTCTKADLAAAAEEALQREEARDRREGLERNPSRRQTTHERNVTKSRSERSMGRKTSSRQKITAERDEDLSNRTDDLDDDVNRIFKHKVSIISPKPGEARCDPHNDLADEDKGEDKVKIKKKRASISMKIPMWGKKKSASSQQSSPAEASNSS